MIDLWPLHEIDNVILKFTNVTSSDHRTYCRSHIETKIQTRPFHVLQMSIRIVLRLLVFLNCWFCTVQEILELLTSQTSIPDDVLATVDLTKRELTLLPEINWGNFSPEYLALFKRETVSGIPAGVKCQSIDWCDSIACTEVCKRGTVELEPWLKSAIKTQVPVLCV